MNRKIGYARVSTTEQSTAAQVEALYEAGCELVFSDSVSGAKKDRVRLREAIAHIGQGDQLVVVKIDRLARSLTDLLQ
ncbi:recombinase family protein [Thalassospira profundimaris]|uniref:recombinase family protein n=1 Tax=Thalassospira profundimaris TaxID=502049 RepID=UPI0009DB6397|nr:recombinase family protein [Thalassospira profundimaris]